MTQQHMPCSQVCFSLLPQAGALQEGERVRAEHLPSLESFLVDHMCAGEHGLPCIITGKRRQRLSSVACAHWNAPPAGTCAWLWLTTGNAAGGCTTAAAAAAAAAVDCLMRGCSAAPITGKVVERTCGALQAGWSTGQR